MIPESVMIAVMKTYLRRSVKYLLWLIILLVALFALMRLTGTSGVAPGDELKMIFGSTRGQLMLVVIVVLAALYPRFGFVRRFVVADPERDMEAIEKAMDRTGFRLAETHPDEWVFVADSLWGRVKTLGEDRIVVRREGTGIVLDGIRREVVRVEFRLTGYLASRE